MKSFDRTRRSLLALPVSACAIGPARAAHAGDETRANVGMPASAETQASVETQASIATQAFVPGSLREILASGAGRPMIVHLWGLTCAPCIVELPRWAAFVRGHPWANVAFVQTDPMPAARVAAALRRAGLEGARHWTAPAPLDERARYEIDPDWAGELPRTVLIGADGRRNGVSGAVAFERVRAWLAQQGVRG